MDPRLAEEIKRRNKLKLQQWEDKMKIVGKFDKSDTGEPETSAIQQSAQPSQQGSSVLPINQLESELSSMFEQMQNNIQPTQNNQQPAQNQAEQTQQQPVQSIVQQPVQTSNVQQTAQMNEMFSKFDIGPANIESFQQTADSVTASQQQVQQPVQQVQTIVQPQQTVVQATESLQTASNEKIAVQKTMVPPVQQEDENAKYLHIDIVDGKIKLARKNMSLEEAVTLLAKVYNSYKSKI